MTLRNPSVGQQALMPRTLPVTTMADLAPYHWVLNEAGALTLRRGAPPKRVKEAAAAYAEGKTSLNEFLDSVGVPRS